MLLKNWANCDELNRQLKSINAKLKYHQLQVVLWEKQRSKCEANLAKEEMKSIDKDADDLLKKNGASK